MVVLIAIILFVANFGLSCKVKTFSQRYEDRKKLSKEQLYIPHLPYGFYG